MMILKKVYSFNIAIFFIIIISYIQSCAVPALSSQLESFNTRQAKNGIIMGSISFPKINPRFSSYFIRIKGLDQDEKIAAKNSTEIHISISQIIEVKHRGQLDNGLTYLFAIERPAGKYEIPSIRLFTNNGIVTSTGYSPSFSIPFDVNKGKITYIGNIIFNEYAVLNDSVIMYRNNYGRDIGAIKKIYPTLEWDNAINDPKIKLEYNDNKVQK